MAQPRTYHRHPVARWATRIMAVAAALTVIAVASPPAIAHSELGSSTPADGTTVEELPERIELVFNQDIAPDFATVTAGPADGAAAGQPTTLEVTVAGPRVTATIPPPLRSGAPAGDWFISYRVTSADGHPIDGQVDFVLRPDPAADSTQQTDEPGASTAPGDQPTTADAAAPPSTRDDTSDSPWLSTMVIGLIALAGTTVALVLLGRRSGRS